MVTLKLSEMTNEVLAFDGSVLEAFTYGRLHVAIIQQIEVLTDHRGHHKLRIDAPGGFPDLEVDETAFPKVNQVVADVQAAKANFRFD
jgi:hypothetical protein